MMIDKKFFFFKAKTFGDYVKVNGNFYIFNVNKIKNNEETIYY